MVHLHLIFSMWIWHLQHHPYILINNNGIYGNIIFNDNILECVSPSNDITLTGTQTSSLYGATINIESSKISLVTCNMCWFK